MLVSTIKNITNDTIIGIGVFESPIKNGRKTFNFKAPSTSALNIGWVYDVTYNIVDSTNGEEPYIEITTVGEGKPPQTSDGIVKWLQQYETIGPIRAKTIYNAVIEYAVDISDEDKVKYFINYVKSITAETHENSILAKHLTFDIISKIKEDLELNYIYEWWVVQIAGLGVATVNLARKIIDGVGVRQISKLKTHPDEAYEMLEKVKGIGFKTIDLIATKLCGIAIDSDVRYKFVLDFLLKQKENTEGSSVFTDEQIISSINILNQNGIYIDNDKFIAWYEENSYKYLHTTIQNAVKLRQSYRASIVEMRIAKILTNIADKPITPLGVKEDDPVLESLSASQREAVHTILTSNVSVLIGGPGTGKSFVVMLIKLLYQRSGKSVRIVAPTGKAASIVGGQTIHKTAYGALAEKMIIGDDLIVIDETSMVNNNTLLLLLSSIDVDRCKILFVGDANQLPPIGCGYPLEQVTSAFPNNVAHLREIHRQKTGSMIPFIAATVNEGKGIRQFEGNNLKIITIPESKEGDPRDLFNEEIIKQYLEAVKQYKTERVLILVPYSSSNRFPNSGDVNTLIQTTRYSNHSGHLLFQKGNVTFYKKDRVIVCKNTKLKTVNGVATFVANGDTGTIQELTNSGIIIKLDRRDIDDADAVIMPEKDIANVKLAYSITVHKSQGSECDCVIIAASQQSAFLFNKALFYTALTRAKEKIIVIGESHRSIFSLYRKIPTRRTSNIRYFIENSSATDKALSKWDVSDTDLELIEE